MKNCKTSTRLRKKIQQSFFHIHNGNIATKHRAKNEAEAKFELVKHETPSNAALFFVH